LEPLRCQHCGNYLDDDELKEYYRHNDELSNNPATCNNCQRDEQEYLREEAENKLRKSFSPNIRELINCLNIAS
jgi:predicted Zn-ribbon and HTH transcriptional regulator